MSFLYLAGLLGGIACMLLLDWRYRLLFWRAPAAAALTTLLGLALYLAWDLAGIHLGIFVEGTSRYATGIALAPDLPLEELFFLIFLTLCTLVGYTGALRVLETRRGSR
ncbi:lycopene cyclase domain-containing protein [Micrococcales bacterium 31B]|nr:lycopene cyclase domain-containing protein [Micrococcales bacterium 31B]